VNIIDIAARSERSPILCLAVSIALWKPFVHWLNGRLMARRLVKAREQLSNDPQQESQHHQPVYCDSTPQWLVSVDPFSGSKIVLCFLLLLP
jgi:hypothetical protein